MTYRYYNKFSTNPLLFTPNPTNLKLNTLNVSYLNVYSGSTGVDGPLGNIGYQGHIGYQGSYLGYNGYKGYQGDTGYQGEKGFNGSDPGSQGNIGNQGNIGQQGPQGNIGNLGDTGDIGNEGSIGLQGLQGSQGLIGNIGSSSSLTTDPIFVVNGGSYAFPNNVLNYSYNGGVSWTSSINLGGSIDQHISCIAYNGRIWLAGWSYYPPATYIITYSYDGKYWYSSASALSLLTDVCESIAWNGEYWFAVGSSSSTPICIKSFDGINWISGPSMTPYFSNVYSVFWTGNRWLIGGQYNTYPNTSTIYSTNGITWNFSIYNQFWTSVNNFATNGKTIIMSAFPSIGVSTDGGISWNSTNAGIQPFKFILWNGSIFLGARSNPPYLRYSYDGSNWFDATSTPTLSTIYCGDWNKKYTLIGGNDVFPSNASIFNSTDLTTWNPSYTVNAYAIQSANLYQKWNGIKTFVIDHPNNSQKYLVHGCLEGPEAGVYYRGMGEITNNHSITIELPSYVSSLATDFTVYLTAIFEDDEEEIKEYNSTKVLNNKFNVLGKNGKFYWTVYGLRQKFEVEPNKSNIKIKRKGPYTWI